MPRRDSLGATAFRLVLQLVGHTVQRLVPGGFAKLAAGRIPNQGFFQSLRMVHILMQEPALVADPFVVDSAVFPSDDASQLMRAFVKAQVAPYGQSVQMLGFVPIPRGGSGSG